MFNKIQSRESIEFGAPFLDEPNTYVEPEKCDCCGSKSNDLIVYVGRFGNEKICNDCFELTEICEQNEQIDILIWLAGAMK